MTYKKWLILLDSDEIFNDSGLGLYDVRLLKIDNSTSLPLASTIINGLQNVNHHVVIITDSRHLLINSKTMLESYEIFNTSLNKPYNPEQLRALIIENVMILGTLNSLTKNARSKARMVIEEVNDEEKGQTEE